MKKVLITGGCGFLGANLAAHAIQMGYSVKIFDNLSRYGSSLNLEWLQTLGHVDFQHGDIRLLGDVTRCVGGFNPDIIFHLAGQVAMTTSLEDPRRDFETNALGALNLLEAIVELQVNPVVIYSSTNKVYGDLEHLTYTENLTRYSIPDFPDGVDENIGLDFRSPYGCSKGSADQYMLDYSRNYGVNAIVFRHSSIFGGRQFSTADQGWIGWFVSCALNTKKNKDYKFTISGNGKQVRDVLFADDLVQCYFSAAEHYEACRGKAFNIGGGMGNSISLVELLKFLEQTLSVKLNVEELAPRSSDQKVFVANIAKAKKHFGWEPLVDKNTALLRMINWVDGI